MDLAIVEKQVRLIKSLTDEGMDKDTATTFVASGLTAIAQRNTNDKALNKVLDLLEKNDEN